MHRRRIGRKVQKKNYRRGKKENERKSTPY